MMDIESEQWGDLRWATDVIDGNGCSEDNLYAAIELARCIASAGASSAIKQAADFILTKPVGSVAIMGVARARFKAPISPSPDGEG